MFVGGGNLRASNLLLNGEKLFATMNLLIILKNTKTVEKLAVVFIINRFLIFLFCRKMDVGAIQKPEKSKKRKIFDYDFTVKYSPESDKAKVPYQATPEAAGYDLHAAEEKKYFTKI